MNRLMQVFRNFFPKHEPVFFVLYESFAHARAELGDKGMQAKKLGGKEILVAMHNNALYVLENRCPHEGKKLHQGNCRDGFVICPYHRHRISLETGWNQTQPGTGRAFTYSVVFDENLRPGIYL
ncbi:MAG: Rieske (2Fe-2S) protein [Bacteroidota bacterium]|jgi:nitrite reductase/ring-hydroxylating ferredoxin subunit